MIADDSNWTVVSSKSRRRGKSHHVPETRTDQLDTSNITPRTEGLRPPNDIYAEYQRIRSQWETSRAALKLREIVLQQNVPISCAICLGIGTFDPPDGGWETKRRTYLQLIAFLIMVDELEKSVENKIPCFFQEPLFTSSDKAFIQRLGHSVIESPEGFDKVTDDCLLFGVHLYWSIYAMALENHIPSIFVGTGWDVWDSVRLGRSSIDIKNMRAMEQTHTKASFPKEPYCTAFTNTSIYRKPEAVEITTDIDKSHDLSLPEGHKKGHVDEEVLVRKLQAATLD